MEDSDTNAPRLGTGAGRLVIVCGLPGSGKTTLATRLAAERRGLRFSPDEWLSSLGFDLWDAALRDRIERLQWSVAEDLLDAGGTAIIEWGTWSRREREELRLNARHRGWAVELRFLDVPLDALWRRIQARAQEDPPIREPDLLRWWETFEPPSREELALYDAPP